MGHQNFPYVISRLSLRTDGKTTNRDYRAGQKVVIVNLNGTAWHLEESAYAALGAYLDAAAQHLSSNPDRDEIVADLEQAVVDRFGRHLGPHKNVVTGADMSAILTEMGPVRDDNAHPGVEPDTREAAGPRHTTAGPDAGGGATAASARAPEPWGEAVGLHAAL